MAKANKTRVLPRRTSRPSRDDRRNSRYDSPPSKTHDTHLKHLHRLATWTLFFIMILPAAVQLSHSSSDFSDPDSDGDLSVVMLPSWTMRAFRGVPAPPDYAHSNPHAHDHPAPHPVFHQSADSVQSTCAAEYALTPAALDSAHAIEFAISRVEARLDALHPRSHVDVRRAIACVFHATLAFRHAAAALPTSAATAPASTQPLLDRIAWATLRYFSRYLAMAREKRLVYFHHISKSGGSGMCAQAWLNGCRAPGAPLADATGFAPVGEFPNRALTDGGNCWSAVFEDKFTWFEGNVRSARKDFSCAARVALAERLGANFMANEGYLAEGVDERPCYDGVLSLEVLRAPYPRTVSHIAHMIRQGYFDGTASECVDEKVRPRGTAHEAFRKLRYTDVNITCYAHHNHVATNNYATRCMAGRDAFLRKADGLLRADLDHAKQALKRFDVLVVLNKRPLAHDVSHALIHKVMLGMHIANENKGFVNKKDYSLNMSDDEVAWLTQRNSLDSELYDTALDLFELDVLLYNRTADLCAAWASGATRLPPSMVPFTDACAAFNHREITATKHFKRVLARRVELNESFACGCGWVDAKHSNTNVPQWIATANRLPARQACPRSSLFPNPTVL